MSGSEPDALPLGDSPMQDRLYAFLAKKKGRGDKNLSPQTYIKTVSRILTQNHL